MLQERRGPKNRSNDGEFTFAEDFERCLKILDLSGQHQPSIDEVKKAYKLLVKQWHPDRFHGRPDMESLAVRKTQAINLAYRYLLQQLEKGACPSDERRQRSDFKRHNYSWQQYSDGFPDPSVTEYFLNSSHIVSAGYSKRRGILYLKFLGDEIYLYFEVPEFIFDHLLRAGSAGKYAMKFIYNRFRHRKFMPITKNFAKQVGQE